MFSILSDEQVVHAPAYGQPEHFLPNFLSLISLFNANPMIKAITTITIISVIFIYTASLKLFTTTSLGFLYIR